jgi:hypothetical protein
VRNRYFIDLGPISTGLNAVRLGFLQPCPIKNLCNTENIPGNFTLSRDPPLSPEHIANFQTMLGSPGIFRLQVGKTPSLSRISFSIPHLTDGYRFFAVGFRKKTTIFCKIRPETAVTHCLRQ